MVVHVSVNVDYVNKQESTRVATTPSISPFSLFVSFLSIRQQPDLSLAAS